METRNREAARSAAEKRRKTERKRVSPEYTYTQPRPFNTRRFFLRLLTAAAVALALLFGMSIFFKVDKSQITVSGAKKYKPEEVIAASGIQDGENLLTLSQAGINGKIIEQLPYVERVRVGIKLPDTVNIEIAELDVTYAIESADERWWLMDATGRIVDEITQTASKTFTCISGLKIEQTQIGGQAAAMEQPAQTDADGETIPVTVTAGDRLKTLISILENLEKNSVIGQISAIDVSDLSALTMQYGQRFKISLGDGNKLGYKIRCMKAAIGKMQSYESGELDVSFTIRPNEVIYTPNS